MAEAKRSYVVDESGNRTAVMLPIDEYERLLEDLQDLAVIVAAQRRANRAPRRCQSRRRMALIRCAHSHYCRNRARRKARRHVEVVVLLGQCGHVAGRWVLRDRVLDNVDTEAWSVA